MNHFITKPNSLPLFEKLDTVLRFSYLGYDITFSFSRLVNQHSGGISSHHPEDGNC